MIKLSGLMLGFSKMAASGGRLFAADRTVIDTIDNGTVALGVFSSILSWLANLIQTFIYTVCKFALNIMDFFQVLAYKLIGVKIGDNTEVLDTSSPLFKQACNKSFYLAFDNRGCFDNSVYDFCDSTKRVSVINQQNG